MSLQFETSTSLGDIVAADYRAAGVFNRLGLDFCCGGKRTFGEACAAARLDPGAVAAELAKLSAMSGADDVPDVSWPVEALAHYIVSRHHAYVRRQLPFISGHLAKLVAVHGERHPELQLIADHFAVLSLELQTHMMKEEQVLFPFIKQLEVADKTPEFTCGSVENPIRVMEAEHDSAGAALAKLRLLNDDYRAPADACNTYRAMLDGLARLEADMHTHVHLENNILFPRAAARESLLEGR